MSLDTSIARAKSYGAISARAASIRSVSKPTITCPSMTVTGVVIAFSFFSSSTAAGSWVTSRSLKTIPFCERYSFVRWQNIQPGCV